MAEAAAKSHHDELHATKATEGTPEREAAAATAKTFTQSYEDEHTELKAQLAELHHAAVHPSISLSTSNLCERTEMGTQQEN